MAKNKVQPHGGYKNTNENTKPNNHLFKSKNAINNNKKQFNNNNEQKNTNQSKFQHGQVKKTYKNNKQQFGGKIRNNKVDVVQQQQQQHETTTSNENKKVFDKKTWRLKKYSKKYKLDQWEEKRKKALLTEYYKQIKHDDDTNKLDVQKIYDQYFDSDEERQTNPKVNFVSNPNFKAIQNNSKVNDSFKSKDNIEMIVKSGNSGNKNNEQGGDEAAAPKKKLSAYHRAQLEYQRLQDEKKHKKDEIVRQKAEREEALKKYKKNKMEKYRKLSKKTRKGQPIMADRMEMLLEKIQSTSV